MKKKHLGAVAGHEEDFGGHVVRASRDCLGCDRVGRVHGQPCENARFQRFSWTKPNRWLFRSTVRTKRCVFASISARDCLSCDRVGRVHRDPCQNTRFRSHNRFQGCETVLQLKPTRSMGRSIASPAKPRDFMDKTLQMVLFRVCVLSLTVLAATVSVTSIASPAKTRVFVCVPYAYGQPTAGSMDFHKDNLP